MALCPLVRLLVGIDLALHIDAVDGIVDPLLDVTKVAHG
jgi:hypothetical protein